MLVCTIAHIHMDGCVDIEGMPMLACQVATPAEREQLRRLVEQWNENRLDLFSLSYPSEDLEIHGVMRFYFQESADKVTTKCIRVSSTATTRAVIDVLVDKFHPDLKMLSNPEYSLWEVHENGEERCLAPEEKPLLVQLNWHKDDREGRFLLRRHDRTLPTSSRRFHDENEDNLKRSQKRFSKREKKELKKKHQRAVAQEKEELAAQLYKAVPPTTFTRTISNPEIVMKKRRERKLEAKLKEMGHGGSLKVYGYELQPSRPYVTLLVSIRDQASKIIRETLDKYGLDKENANDYALVQVKLPSSCKISRSLSDLRTLEDGGCEHYVDDNEYPLLNLGPDVIFLVRPRRHHSLIPPTPMHNASTSAYANLIPLPQHGIAQSSQYTLHPCLLSLRSEGGRTAERNAVMLQNGVTEVGSAQSVDILLGGELVWPRHAAITFSSGVVTITPSVPNALIEVNGEMIHETVVLKNGDTITIGRIHTFQYFDQVWYLEGHFKDDALVCLQMPKMCSVDGVRRETNLTSLGNFTNEPGRLVLSGVSMETTFGVDGSVRALSALPRSLRQSSISRSTVDLRRLGAAKQYEPLHGSMCDLRGTSQRVTSAYLSNMLSSLKGHNFESTPDFSTSQRRTDVQASSSSEEIPALLKVPEDGEFLAEMRPNTHLRHDSAEDELLSHVLSDYAGTLQFKLAPAFIVYMVVRHRLVAGERLSREQCAQSVRMFVAKIAQRIRALHTERSLRKELYAFWMANSSEMLNFLKQDVDLQTITEGSPQQLLVECVESSFNLLSRSFKDDLLRSIGSLIDCRLDDNSACNETIMFLSEAVHVLRKHRVNAALTIQLFSQLFFYISAEVFNWLVSPAGAPYCSTAFGVRLSTRLANLHSWAKQQGMELPAICHMDKIQQAVNLLTTPKTVDDVTTLGATCYKLNSVQELIESVVRLAETQADRMAIEDGTGVQLEENSLLQLPFLLPEDGYCSSVLYSVPPSVTSFIGTLQQQGLCCLLPQINSTTGSWTVHFCDNGARGAPTSAPQVPLHSMQVHGSTSRIINAHGISSNDIYGRTSSLSGCSSMQSLNRSRNDGYTSNTAQSLSQQERVPKIVQISFSRGTGGIGLSIVAAQVCSVPIWAICSAADKICAESVSVPSAFMSRRSSMAAPRIRAAEMMSRSGPVVSFEVSKQAAHYNGLEGWLSNPPSVPSVQAQPIPRAQHPESISSSVPDYTNQPYGIPYCIHHECVDDYRRQHKLPEFHIKEILVHIERYQRTGNASRYGRQNSTSSTSTSLYSNSAGYERNLNNNMNGPGALYQSGAGQLPFHYAQSMPDSQLRATRSVSASELYHGQVDSTTPTSIPLQKQRVLPSHYRAARPVVIQPSRPSPSPTTLRRAGAASPSHLHPYTPSTSAQPETVRGIGSRSQTPTVDEWRSMQRQPSPSSHSFAANSLQQSTDYPRTGVASMPNLSKREELNARLDKLEAKGTAMNEFERRIYRNLVDELSRAPAQRQLQRPRHLPPPQPIKPQVVNSVHEESPGGKQLDKLLEDVQQQIHQIDLESPKSKASIAPAAPPPQVDNEENIKKKKGVQWNDERTAEEHRGDGDAMLLFNDDEVPEPRVQVLGAQEVYRDPRQRRLNEIQAKQNASHPHIDGANLGFRDKMKLFAEQLGEKTPKSRYKSSSAQREIEHSIESS
uniref:Afadin n=1 Tax=Ascaris lumbricoides TaxID=6252 RepID=A0A0M3HPD6_ASCLU